MFRALNNRKSLICFRMPWNWKICRWAAEFGKLAGGIWKNVPHGKLRSHFSCVLYSSILSVFCRTMGLWLSLLSAFLLYTLVYLCQSSWLCDLIYVCILCLSGHFCRCVYKWNWLSWLRSLYNKFYKWVNFTLQILKHFHKDLLFVMVYVSWLSGSLL